MQAMRKKKTVGANGSNKLKRLSVEKKKCNDMALAATTSTPQNVLWNIVVMMKPPPPLLPCHPSSPNDGDQKSIWNDCGILPIDNVQRHPHAKGKKERFSHDI